MGAPRVLVVDDARFMRMMLTELLNESGFNVVGHAENGDEALVKFREIRPDIVTMDIMMPGKDGLTALRALVAEAPQIPVVVVSALEQPHVMEQAMSMGAAQYITKPFSPAHLIDVMQTVSKDSGYSPSLLES